MTLTMLQHFFGIDNIIGLYWTLQIELIFYVACSTLFLAGLLKKPEHIMTITVALLVAALALALARYETGRKLPVALPLALSVMFLGFAWRRYTV